MLDKRNRTTFRLNPQGNNRPWCTLSKAQLGRNKADRMRWQTCWSIVRSFHSRPGIASLNAFLQQMRKMS